MRHLSSMPFYRHGMLKIVDIFSATENFQLADMRESLDYNQKRAQQGLPLDHTVLLSDNDGIRAIVETIRLLSHDVSIKFDVFSTIGEAIDALGLSAHQQEILEFYDKFKDSRKELTVTGQATIATPK